MFGADPRISFLSIYNREMSETCGHEDAEVEKKKKSVVF